MTKGKEKFGGGGDHRAGTSSLPNKMDLVHVSIN